MRYRPTPRHVGRVPPEEGAVGVKGDFVLGGVTAECFRGVEGGVWCCC